MALDKAVDSAQLNADLTAVADAIRTKGGTSAQLAFPDGFVSAVQAIEGAPDLQIVVTTSAGATVTATNGGAAGPPITAVTPSTSSPSPVAAPGPTPLNGSPPGPA